MSASLINQLNTLWPDTEWRVMFHGTCLEFPCFTEEGIGRGGDDNSALGVHLAEWPGASGEYAEAGASRNEGQPRVLMVALPALKPQEEPDYYRFFGFDEAGMPDPDMGKEGFARLRQTLLAEGVDVVDFEDGEGPISVALNPHDLVILGSLTLEQAQRLQESMDDMADPYDAVERVNLALAQGIELTFAPLTQNAPSRPFKR